jgi:hypothetical protein
MTLTKFDAPGFLDDLDAQGQAAWSSWISSQLDEARLRDGKADGLANYGPRPQFFNPLTKPPAADAVEKDITWTAFPRVVKISSISDVQRWRSADSSRDVQDEYCEWSVVRDPHTDKITRVDFTSEGPEYWQFLAATDPAKVVALYQKYINPVVKESDLFQQGSYVTRNKWNNSTANGAMHLIQRANTLGAEIELAAAATLVRTKAGSVVTGEQELIQCGRYGEAERNSDPHIGAVVNELARMKADVTLANPVGLCIDALSVAGWETPDGSNAHDYWKIVRGTEQKALRGVFEVPSTKTFVVGDIKIGGRKIEFGGQIADFITIKLTGLATRIGISATSPVGCVDELPQIAGVAAPVTTRPSVNQALNERAFSARR